MKTKTLFIHFYLLFLAATIFAQQKHFIFVAKDGSEDFTTITAAIKSLPMFNYERVIIYIKNGVYNEKLLITQDYVTLKGENRDSTIIEYNQLRTDWIANKDSIGPAVINIHGDDIILENFTIENTHPEIGPHAFAVYGDGTRTIITKCNVFSKGGDTVSLWDYKTGMYYHSDCVFKGAVDFVCPRGWCFIKNSQFYEEKNTASIWHAGGYDINQKFVIRNCSFDGIKGFQLGRHHYEAQFYLLDCVFSQNMADKSIYRVTYDDTSRNRPFNWGERYYFFNCHHDGKDFYWLRNNLNTAKGSPSLDMITAEWTFDGKWNPESIRGPVITKYEIHNKYVLFFFNDRLSVEGNPVFKSKTGVELHYTSGAGSDTLRFDSNDNLSKKDLKGLVIINRSRIIGNTANLSELEAELNID